jgi:hypothetical protein
MRVLLTLNGSLRTSPKVKSSPVCESGCHALKRSRSKPFLSVPGASVVPDVCNVEVNIPLSAFHLSGRVLDGPDDTVVGAAAAEVIVHSVKDILFRWLGFFNQEAVGIENHS